MVRHTEPDPTNDVDTPPAGSGSSSGTGSRRTFFTSLTTATLTTTGLSPLLLSPKPSPAFEGGVGGLGKTKPQTGIVYANADLTPPTISGTPLGGGADFSAELLAPDNRTPALLSFYAPWPMMRSGGIESRDLANPEAAFVQVAPLGGAGGAGELSAEFFGGTVFGPKGKYGAYGTPTDIRVRRAVGRGEGDPTNAALYTATFTTLTPSMIESDRKALIAVSVVGDGVFMLVVGTTAARFKKQEGLLMRAAESFSVVEAPKTGMRR